jgi:hypothetical protein
VLDILSCIWVVFSLNFDLQAFSILRDFRGPFKGCHNSKRAVQFPIFSILLLGVVLVISHNKLFDNLFSYGVRKNKL